MKTYMRVVYDKVKPKRIGMKMKICPNCHLELPDEAHFCPRCMFQYPKQEIHIKEKKNKTVLWFIFAGILLVGFLAGILLVRNYIQNNAGKKEVDIQSIREQYFDTGEDIEYNSEIENDLRNILGSDFVDVQSVFGEETEAMYQEENMNIHTFGNVTVTVNQDAVIQDVTIDYTVETDIKKYGIYGIDGKSDMDTVKSLLGTPDQDYGDEFCYRFDRELSPGLNIYFSDTGVVEKLEYYYVQ